jgi:hypothetical protein
MSFNDHVSKRTVSNFLTPSVLFPASTEKEILQSALLCFMCSMLLEVKTPTCQRPGKVM